MTTAAISIPTYGLYGGDGDFPDIMHCEGITDRAVHTEWVISPHRHAALHQILLIGAGGARATLDGHAFTIRAPTLLSVPRRVVHGFAFPRGQKGFVLSLQPETLPMLFGPDAGPARALSRWHAVPAPAGIDAAFGTIVEELAEARPLRDAVLLARAIDIVAALLRAEADRTAEMPGPRPSEGHMRRFDRLIPEGIREGWRVGDYARAMGMSADHLGRICRAETGLAPARYAEARRMAAARRELAYTAAPVSAIAYDLGFADPAYFSRAFRRSEGLSPRQYRRDHAGVRG